MGAGAGSDLLAQSTMYDPNAPAKPAKEKVVTGKRDAVLRKGGGKVWEDPTLIDWDPSESSLALGLEVVSRIGVIADRQSGIGSLWGICPTT